MILKYRTIHETIHETSREPNSTHKVDRWNYVDGVTDCSVYYDQDAGCTVLEYTANGRERPISIALHGEAYLINNNGKTVEKIGR